MIPLKIKFTNFLGYKTAEFDFTEMKHIATVVGENGAGKTSFCVDGITWAVYGQGTKGGLRELDNYITNGEDNCSVEFDFQLDKHYKIIRNRSSRKDKTSLAFFMVQDGDSIPLSQGGINEVQALIIKTIKMNYNTFISSCMMLQGKSNFFTEGLSDEDRKEIITSILDVKEFEDIATLTEKDLKDMKNKILINETKLQNITSIIEGKDKYLSEQTQYLKEIKTNEKELKDKEKELSKVAKEVEKTNALKSELNFLKNNLRNDQTLSEENKNTIINLQSKITANKEKIQKEQEILSSEQEILNAVKKEQELNGKIQDINKNLVIHNELLTKIADITNKGTSWKETHNKSLNKLIEQNKIYEKQVALLTEVPCTSNQTLQSSCPLLSMAIEAKMKLENNNKELLVLEEKTNPYTDEYKKVREEITTIEKSIDKELLISLKKELELTTKTSSLFSELQIAKSNIENLTNQIKEQSDYIIQIQNKNNDIENNIKKITQEISVKENEYSKLQEIETKYNKQVEDINTLQSIISQIKENLIKTETLLKQIETNEKENLTLTEETNNLKEELEILNILTVACNKKEGVPAFLVENTIPEIESIANSVLATLLNGRLSIKFETQLETKTTKNIKEVLKIFVIQDGFQRNYITFSGAEKFTVDLAIRYALSKFLSHRAGSSIEMFVLDEGLGCTDEKNRYEIIEIIRAFAQNFKKVFVITHIEELKDVFDQKIVIENNFEGNKILLV